MGRPTKITPDQMAPYFEAIRNGMPLSRAADLAGVSHETTRKARRLLWFVAAEKKARADAIAERVAVIRAAHKQGTWTAAAWWLERQESDDFRERREQQLTGNQAAPVAVRIINPAVAAAAAFALGPDADRPPPGQAENPGDGSPLG